VSLKEFEFEKLIFFNLIFFYQDVQKSSKASKPTKYQKTTNRRLIE